MKSLNSSEKILKLLKEIRWDHCYSKKADASEGELSDTDSCSTVSAASPPCYYSGDDDDFVITPASSAIIPENEPLPDKKNHLLFVKSGLVYSENSIFPDENNLSDCITDFLGAMEVIELSDDEIGFVDAPTEKPSSMKRPFRCINSECRAEKDLLFAQLFVRRYYGTPPSRKKRKVCRRCFDKVKQEQDHLTEVLESGRLLLAEKLPPPKTTVVLTDSDTDPSDYASSTEGSELEVECDEGKTLEETIENIMTDLQLDSQINLGVAHLDKRLKAVQEGFDKLHAEEYASIEKELDMVRTEFYNSFRPEIMWLPGLDIGPSSTVIHQPDGTSEVIAESSIFKPSENLPPVGPLNRYQLHPGEMCFCMKYSLFARWVQAQVIEVDKCEPNNTFYKVIYNSTSTKSSGSVRVLPGRQIAYFDKCLTKIPVGTRVIGKYKDEDPQNLAMSGSFYVGVLAEIPTAANKYRYLVFFDDGYAQYVHHNDIRVVTEASASPWDDVSSDSREFIREYLQMYPERPMVRLQKHNFVKTEYNGRWWRAQVMEVDGSLVRMFFPVDCRSEWIYRGSTRLSPLFNKKIHIQAQAEQFKTIRRRTAWLPGRAIVEYGTFGQGHDAEPLNQGERRAVAKKSTVSRASSPPREIQFRVEQESRGFTNKHTLQEQIIKYRRHVCCSKCLRQGGNSMLEHKDVSPLLHPIIQGWSRLVVKQKRKAITKNEIYYVTPCGLRLRNIEEVSRYIVNTESNLEIDCFTFETGIEISHEWEPFKKILFIEDITDGEENVKISCVNSLDDIAPIKLLYSNVRLPTEHVPLNLDQGFLVCCDCLDNCQNKDKCACRQLTIQGTQILNHVANRNAGYQHRRLYDQVQSGIYECNSRCNCAQNRCSNRVVQHPLKLKLQLFKTARRGWGVRTLCDIPRGAFICVYVGKMLSESIANEEGKQMIGGDDYYAELDYIEVMENAKEGFEEEAILPEAESLSILLKDNFKPPRLGSDLIDSDGLFSEIDADDDDRDFSQPSYHKNDNVEKRQKSARLQERARGTKSNHTNAAAGSAAHSEEEKTKNDDGDKGSESKDGSNTVSCDPSDDEEDDDEKQRRPQTFLPSQMLQPLPNPRKSVREYYGKDESVYIMDAKQVGNIGRYLNHSCEPNVFVQNVFVDTHDLRFPWVAFFAIHNIRAGTELTWDYNYEVDSVPDKIKYCYCGAKKCRGRLL
ncbi:histone-lysine N-methyltransferase eggless-like isoform X1 [Palaemon carinicauda]|uniref:histone-lysine N-methyltransferase eggless-like isoform X1 n=1 Tax=Palaemon carinicauda TaxID=392227 RepID=UPI0035B5B579